jgi:hypothetical protein
LKFDFTGDGTVDNNFEACVAVSTHYYAVWPSLDASSPCALWRKIGPDSPDPPDADQLWIYTPDGSWSAACPPEPTLPNPEPYDSCP